MYMLKYKCWQRLKQASPEIWKQRGRRTSQEPLKSENQRLGNFTQTCAQFTKDYELFSNCLYFLLTENTRSGFQLLKQMIVAI